MNRITLSLVVLAATWAANVHAESPTVDSSVFVSARSGSEVQAELASFRQSGIDPWAIAYQPLRELHGSTSRAQVQADYLAARDEVHALSGEDSGSAYLARRRAAPAPGALASLR